MSIDKIRKRFSDAYPVINRQVDDDVIKLSKSQRDQMLDEWAQYAFQTASDRLRQTRNRLLADSDWTQAPDAPADSAAWAKYRQQLRDLPANTDDVENVKWPTPPS